MIRYFIHYMRCGSFWQGIDGYFPPEWIYYDRTEKGVMQECVRSVRSSLAYASAWWAGALVEVMVIPRPKTRKTAVGKAMQRMGNAVDSALETVAEKMN